MRRSPRRSPHATAAAARSGARTRAPGGAGRRRTRSGTSPTTRRSGCRRRTRPRYARALPASPRRAITAVDPAARVIVGGLTHPRGVPAGDASRRAQASPEHVDGVAIHPYGRTPAGGARPRARAPGACSSARAGRGAAVRDRVRLDHEPAARARTGRLRRRAAISISTLTTLGAPRLRRRRDDPLHVGHARAESGEPRGLVRHPLAGRWCQRRHRRVRARGSRCGAARADGRSVRTLEVQCFAGLAQTVATEPLTLQCSSASAPRRNGPHAGFGITWFVWWL